MNLTLPPELFHRTCVPDWQANTLRTPIMRGVRNQALAEFNGETNLFYCFMDEPLKESGEAFEIGILESIRRNRTGLLFYKTQGISRDQFCTPRTQPVYRLKCGSREFDFDLLTKDGKHFCHALIFLVSPHAQGNFFAAKKFLVGQVAKTLFDLPENRITAIRGRAMENRFPLRGKTSPWNDWRGQRTKDGTTKLMRFYERMGFVREHPDYDWVVLLSEQTRAEFAASDSPAKRLLAENQGKLAR